MPPGGVHAGPEHLGRHALHREYQIRRSGEDERTVTVCLAGSFLAFPGDRVSLRLDRMGLSGVFRVAEAVNACSPERGATAALTLKGG